MSWYHVTALLIPHSHPDGVGHPCPNSLIQPQNCPLLTFTPLQQQPCSAAALAPPARIRNSSANLELCKIAAISASTSTTSPSWGQRNGHRPGVLDMCPRGLQPPSQMTGRAGAHLGPKPEETPTNPKHQVSNHSGKPPWMSRFYVYHKAVHVSVSLSCTFALPWVYTAPWLPPTIPSTKACPTDPRGCC